MDGTLLVSRTCKSLPLVFFCVCNNVFCEQVLKPVSLILMSNCSRSAFEAIIETVCCENLPMKHIQEQYEMSPPCSMYFDILECAVSHFHVFHLRTSSVLEQS